MPNDMIIVQCSVTVSQKGSVERVKKLKFCTPYGTWSMKVMDNHVRCLYEHCTLHYSYSEIMNL